MERLERRYEISLRTVLITMGILILFWLVIQLKLLLVALFVALIFTLALDPVIVRLKSWRIPRPVGVILTFLLLIILFFGVVAYGFTPMINQMGRFLLNLPAFLDPILSRLGPLPLTDEIRSQIFSQLTTLSARLLDSTVAIASNSILIGTILIFTFYLLLDWENVRKRFIEFFNRSSREKIENTINEIEHQLGGWVRGVLALMAIVGVLVFIGLSIFGIEFALPLALIAAVLEIVPMIGPLVAAIPAVVVGFSSSVWLGVGVIILYVVVQQVQNNFIAPMVLGKSVGFSPLLTLIILFIGTDLFGIAGLLLAVPTALFLSIIVRDLLVWGEK